MRKFNFVIAILNSFLAGALAAFGEAGAAAFVGATAILCAVVAYKEPKT